LADQLHVQLYKLDVKDVHKRQPKANFNLEGFFGLETGFSYDKEANVLAIVCLKQVSLFSFENRDNLIQFEIKIRKSLGEGNKKVLKVSFSLFKIPCVLEHLIRYSPINLQFNFKLGTSRPGGAVVRASGAKI
jgi:hypothetical protein